MDVFERTIELDKPITVARGISVEVTTTNAGASYDAYLQTENGFGILSAEAKKPQAALRKLETATKWLAKKLSLLVNE